MSDDGQVQATIRIMPASPEVDLDDVEEDVESLFDDDDADGENDTPRGVSVGEFEREAVGFGLEALVVAVRVDDADGGADAVAEAIEDVEGVESVRVESVTRV